MNGKNMDIVSLFLEFEEVLGIAILFLLVLMYIFYIKYPYDKDLEWLLIQLLNSTTLEYKRNHPDKVPNGSKYSNTS